MSIRKQVEIATADANYSDSEKKLGIWTTEGLVAIADLAYIFKTSIDFMDAEGQIRGLPKRSISKLIIVFDKAE